jgi:hypothetical protein
MLKVEIQSQELRELSFKYRGTEIPVKEQTGWITYYDRSGNPEPHPRPLAIRMDQGQVPYPNGHYTVHPSSFYPGDYNAMKVSPSVKLVPAKAELKTAA